jgi:U3 small nucleolar RNA-associated protein 24
MFVWIAYAISVCTLQAPSALFFSYNMALEAPYQVIVDTNFINFSIHNKVCL